MCCLETLTIRFPRPLNQLRQFHLRHLAKRSLGVLPDTVSRECLGRNFVLDTKINVLHVTDVCLLFNRLILYA